MIKLSVLYFTYRGLNHEKENLFIITMSIDLG